MKKLLLTITIVIYNSICYSQIEDAWVFFKDKPDANSYLSNPLLMLSQRSIDRRNTQNIAIDTKDVPVDQYYYTQIKNSANIEVLAKSKWMNSVYVRGEQTVIDGLSNTFTFIEKIDYANKSLNSKPATKKESKTLVYQNKFENIETDFNYGVAENQVTMLKSDFLHQNGFTGDGMYIAVIDAGFPGVDTHDGFKRLRDNNKILGGYDFVNRTPNFYTGHNHGTLVLSDIGGYIENSFVGTAPDASFYLFITENVNKEEPLEESLWVEAAERADSLGVDIINTSLGYSVFDNASYSYSYQDMNGESTYISRAAEIGVSRGMILVNSAGNSGNSAWKYITAPADAPSVLTVGAVNANENIASFSSFGPTFDGRIKPEVLAQGQSTYVISNNFANPSISSGTSFSSPVMAGAVACFWQAFPTYTNMEIMQRIKESADRYNTPTDQHGYGIPNFEQAYMVLSNDADVIKNDLQIFPNPAKDIVNIHSNIREFDITVINLQGEIIDKKKTTKSINIDNLAQGMYILQLETDDNVQRKKIIKL